MSHLRNPARRKGRKKTLGPSNAVEASQIPRQSLKQQLNEDVAEYSNHHRGPLHTATERSSFTLLPNLSRIAAISCVLSLASGASAQVLAQPSSSGLAPDQTNIASVELPDAPSATMVSAPGDALGSSSSALSSADPQADIAKTAPTSRPLRPTQPPVAGPYQLTIAAGQVGPALTNRQKVLGGLRDSISPFTLSGEIISAGYSHITNGSPNYGTDAPAFGSRVGASFARGTSQNLFTEAALAPLLHEDIRYYQLGSTVPFFERLFYAGTRPLITRTDGGHRTPNLALLGGYLGAAYLTRTYNPVLNQSNDEVLKIYGTSLGGAAIGDVVTEFLPGFLQVLHLAKFSHL